MCIFTQFSDNVSACPKRVFRLKHHQGLFLDRGPCSEAGNLNHNMARVWYNPSGLLV